MAKNAEELLKVVLTKAIEEVRRSGIDVFTFAFYHDHESGAVSICADTETRSRQSVRSHNAFVIKYFIEALNHGDLKKMALFNANTGRSLSLGDFELVNVARTRLGRVRPDEAFYMAMIRTLRATEPEILELSSDPQRVLFCASSADAEVGFTWAAELGIGVR
jgi:hypothetical protein